MMFIFYDFLFRPKTSNLFIFSSVLATCQIHRMLVYSRARLAENVSSHTVVSWRVHNTASNVTMKFNMLFTFIQERRKPNAQWKWKKNEKQTTENNETIWTVWIHKQMRKFGCSRRKKNLFTRFGSANMQSVFFRPIKFDNIPNTQLPRIAPIEKHDPIHETSVKLTGPFCSGEWSDCNFGNAIESHDIARPCDNEIIFAIEKWSDNKTL